MKKSTGIFLLLTFFIVVIVLVALFVTLIFFIVQDNPPNLLGSKRIALIRVEGVIYDAEDWIDQVEDYQEDSSIRGIVLRVESPGGAVGPSQDLYEAIVRAQEVYGKVVVASFGSVAASGGYYIACSADRIISTQGSLTGSIGVYAKFPVAKELMEKIGFSYDTVKAGEYKDFGAMERGLSEKERQMMQGVIDDTYEQFVEAVAKGRKKAFERLIYTWKENTPITYPFTEDLVEVIQEFQRTHQAELAQYQEQLKANQEQEDRFAGVFLAHPNVAADLDEDIGMDAIGGIVVNATAPENASDEIVASVSPSAGAGTAKVAEATLSKPKNIKVDKKTIYAFAKAVSEGKVYTGRQAKKVGLVDQLGSLNDAITLAARLSGIKGKPTVVEKKKRSRGLIDLLSKGWNALQGKQNYSPLQYKFPY